jgi:hypothetical protein
MMRMQSGCAALLLEESLVYLAAMSTRPSAERAGLREAGR